MKITNLFTVFITTYLLVGCEFQVKNFSKLEFKEYNSNKKYKLVRRIRDNGSLGSTFLGYSVKFKNKFYDVDVPDYDLIDTVEWKNDTLIFIVYSIFKDSIDFKEKSYYFKKDEFCIFIKQRFR